MPIGGKLVLKGGATLGGGGVEKKKKKKKASANGGAAEAAAAEAGAGGGGAGPSSSADPEAAAAAAGKGGEQEALPKDKLPEAYERQFAIEAKRLQQGRERATAWGATYRAPPAVLHGRTAPIHGDTAEERLDLRAASKADRYCK